MNQKAFLKELENTLKNKGIQTSDIQEVVDDYASMINEAIASGEDEEAFIMSLGRPSKIIKNLHLQKTQLQKNKEKIIGMSPFIAIIIFFLVGFLLNGFAYSWLAFLLIPMTAIFLEDKGMERFIGLSVFVAIFIYFGLGFSAQLWHPGWLVFTLIIPLSLWGEKKVYPLALTVLSLGLIGLYTFFEINSSSSLNLFFLLPLIPIAFVSGALQIEIGEIRQYVRELVLGALFIGFMTGVYIYLGFAFGWWHPGWLIFLLIPIGGMLYDSLLKKEKHPLVSYMPFISVILFIIIGEIWNAYAFSWLAFLLIPMVGILTEKGE